MQRDAMMRLVRERSAPFDVVVIGGGATGLGVAVDAASRGYATLLLEQSDFGKGTSSRSTKLIHGGVRYLQSGDVGLVMEALEERGILRRNAPHLVADQRFIVPTYDWWEGPFYGVGLKVYDLLAGRHGFGRSKLLSRDETIAHIPTLRTDGLRGGVLYHDGQFDDARLLIALARTAAREGAVLVNYARVIALDKGEDGMIEGVSFRDQEDGRTHVVKARVVISATGPFTDTLMRLDDPKARRLIEPSQGVHIVLSSSFLPGDAAIMVPHTSDGRVMFAIPWQGRTLVGTTDTPVAKARLEPRPTDDEVEFLLTTARQYLIRPPQRSDVLATFAGIRPLVRAAAQTTAKLSREHSIHITRSGMVAICGGKWTTYRQMAQDAVDRAATVGLLEKRACVTEDLRLHGYSAASSDRRSSAYGSDNDELERHLRAEPSLASPIHGRLPYLAGEVVWAARHEMARTVDDVLARRTRALVLDAAAAAEAAPVVATLLTHELGRDAAWARTEVEQFRAIADVHRVRSAIAD